MSKDQFWEVGARCSRGQSARAAHGESERHQRQWQEKVGGHCRQQTHITLAANLLQRNCTAGAPNEVWTGDITYIATDKGWLYLAVVFDLFSRQVEAGACGRTRRAHVGRGVCSRSNH